MFFSSWPGRILLIEQRPVHERAVDEVRIGRKSPRAGAGVSAVVRERELDRVRELRELDRVVHPAENRPVVEDTVAGPDDRLALGIERTGEPDARAEVVLVDRVVLVAPVNSGLSVSFERDELEIVAQADVDRVATDPPLVLREELVGVVLDELLEGPGADGEPLGIGPRIGGVERPGRC